MTTQPDFFKPTIYNINTVYDLLNGAVELDDPQQITEEVYWEFLEMLPPIYCNGGFMISEAITHTKDGALRSKFTKRGSKYYHTFVNDPDNDMFEVDYYGE